MGRLFVVTVATPCPKETALCLLLGGDFGSNKMRTGQGWGILDPKNSNPLEILLQEFRHQIDLNASEQGFVRALWHATNEEE